jgi:uncharacterized protein YbaR (Trm112 family)
MALSEQLLAILACPQCKGPLHYEQDSQGLTCTACRLRYPIREGIPVMLMDEAEKLS